LKGTHRTLAWIFSKIDILPSLYSSLKARNPLFSCTFKLVTFLSLFNSYRERSRSRSCNNTILLKAWPRWAKSWSSISLQLWKITQFLMWELVYWVKERVILRSNESSFKLWQSFFRRKSIISPQLSWILTKTSH